MKNKMTSLVDSAMSECRGKENMQNKNVTQ
jgi:hypothetical protein